MYANPTDEQYHQLIDARTATRSVMVLLSAAGWTADDIAAPLHHDPKTVRWWITRHDVEGLAVLPDRPRSGRPRLG